MGCVKGPAMNGSLVGTEDRGQRGGEGGGHRSGDFVTPCTSLLGMGPISPWSGLAEGGLLAGVVQEETLLFFSRACKQVTPPVAQMYLF